MIFLLKITYLYIQIHLIMYYKWLSFISVVPKLYDSGFVEDNFSMDWAGGCFKMVQVSLHLFLLIWHQVHLRLSGIRSQRLGTPDLSTTKVLCQRRQWHHTPVLLPGKSHGWRSLVGCSPWGHEELDTTEWLHFHFSLSCVGEGNGTPLQCSCLENPRDGGAWWAAVYGVTQSQTWLKWLAKCYADFFWNYM